MKNNVLKTLSSIIKFLIYSNIFVSLCVTAFTHLTYIIYNLPTENLYTILLMVFSFTFFTYNGQRIIKFRNYTIQKKTQKERLNWILKHNKTLSFFSVFFGLIGLVCSFFINSICWHILIPMGGLSIFYVIPLLPFYKKSPTLRDIPFLKIFIIALVWSMVVVGIPFFDTTNVEIFLSEPSFYLISTLLFSVPVFLFIIGITIPFDIRDINYDKQDNLKTLPSTFGIKTTIIISELSLLISIYLLHSLVQNHFIFVGLLIAHIITMILILFSNEKRKETFFSGWIESTVLIMYGCVVISEYCFSL